MKKKIIVTIFCVILAIFIFALKCEAADLDKINNYTTTVTPRDDSTLDIRYHIEWEVLDSTTQGPLEWVKIGIPNQHVDEIRKISKNIKKIKYLSSGGNFVRIDFDKEYKAGEIITFEFSIHQSYMYTIDNSKGKVSFEFTPGWFEDIKVEQAVIKWKAADIQKHNGKAGGDYVIWNKSLGKNQKITAKVEYSVGRFNLDYNKQARKQINSSVMILIIFVVFIIVYVISMVFAIISPSYYRHGGYGYYGGYYPYGHHYYHHHHHHGRFGGFGGGGFRRRRRIFMCVCLCMCRRRACRLCKKGFLRNKLKNT